MTAVTANELKTRGVSALEEALHDGPEAVITVRGKDRFVVMGVEAYNHFRECELEAALLETRRDLEQGAVFHDTVKEHVERILHEEA